MHDLAVVSKIQSISPIEGRDRIVLAKVENYNTIVAKDEFKEGDTVVYVFYDSILPEKEEFEFLRKRCYSAKWKGFRIRPMKMGGIVSEGLVLPMSSLPKGDYKIGQVVTDDLGIRYYDPESLAESDMAKKRKKRPIINFLCKMAWFRHMMYKIDNRKKSDAYYPDWVAKSDEDNIEKIYDLVSDYKEDFYVTEKVEGMATSFVYNKRKFSVYSHNWKVKSGAWYEFAKIYDMKGRLERYCLDHKLKGICVQGELIGPGIQHNIYKRNGLEFYIYGGFILMV